ncbi:hypothetical protein LXT21_22205 [Myxococcus sp. K38C18041901]|nr:hypothetical protein [Myxococcus guangdongensis]
MCNGDIGFPVTVTGSERDGLFSPGGHAQLTALPGDQRPSELEIEWLSRGCP